MLEKNYKTNFLNPIPPQALPPLKVPPIPRTANQRLEDAKNLAEIACLLGDIWKSGELHVLFADTGVGKSVFGIGLADALTKGISYLKLLNGCKPLIGIYYDFELSDRQFRIRYTDKEGNVHLFSTNLYVDNVDFQDLMKANINIKFDELLYAKIKHDIEAIKPDFIVIDNLTALCTQTTQDTQVALEIMRFLNELKRTYNISILVLAHTPKRQLFYPITINDLAGSKNLSNLADSVSAIGFSKQGKEIRYIKQVKPSRSAEMMYGADNVITCQLHQQDSMLNFDVIGLCPESDHLENGHGNLKEERQARARTLRQQGKTLQEIADELGVGKSTIERWVK